jgi:DNA-binding NarL/FixJ family response regulator
MEITEVGSGEEGLEKLGSHPVDLVFMDIGLPGQSGLEATKRIKADYPDITVIILTTYDLPEFKEAAIRFGASGFVVKLSLKMDEIFALITCFQNAKQNGRRPNYIRFTGGFDKIKR